MKRLTLLALTPLLCALSSGCALRIPGPARAVLVEDIHEGHLGEKHAESPAYGEAYEERTVSETLVRQPLSTVTVSGSASASTR